jgi:hypothetical protein
MKPKLIPLAAALITTLAGCAQVPTTDTRIGKLDFR